MVLPITNPTKSYWIEAAQSKLDRNHRSTPELPKTTDVLIIGSGYTGSSFAYWMTKYAGDQCPEMLLLEARGICEGATGRNGGQLRPHIYSRYTAWSGRFGDKVAYDLIAHEMAHLDVFQKMLAEEGIAEEVCFKPVETTDVIQSESEWQRLKNEYDQMKKAYGADDRYIKQIRVVDDPKEAEQITQIKGVRAAIVHPSGQIWPYKFVHALLRIVLQTGRLNLQANTPALSISKRDSSGYITVKTARGSVRAKTVIHANNRWAGHMLPELNSFIEPGRGTLCAYKAPANYIQRSGGQHFTDTLSNYHLQLPSPHNAIILGGFRPVVTHIHENMASDREDIQFPGSLEYSKTWTEDYLLDWQGGSELALKPNEGGIWTGVWGTSIDAFPFVGQVPKRPGNFIAAVFNGHGMPRILLTTAHLAPNVLRDLGIKPKQPESLKGIPPLPLPFVLDEQRLSDLKKINKEEWWATQRKGAIRGAQADVARRFAHLVTKPKL